MNKEPIPVDDSITWETARINRVLRTISIKIFCIMIHSLGTGIMLTGILYNPAMWATFLTIGLLNAGLAYSRYCEIPEQLDKLIINPDKGIEP